MRFDGWSVAALQELAGDGYLYLASPCTLYPRGHSAAVQDVTRVRIALMHRGLYCYSPIAESYVGVKLLNLPIDHAFWHLDNLSKMRAARGMLVARLPTWEQSIGVREEIRTFEKWGRPVIGIDNPLQEESHAVGQDEERVGVRCFDSYRSAVA